MVSLPYNGTWITCGSYAFLHAAGLDGAWLLPVENSAGATFGMASFQGEWDHTRMLMPAFDFHAGIDEAANLWGVELEHYVCGSFGEFLTLHGGSEPCNYVVGPVNMAALDYLPLSNQYHCADHYIALHRENGYTLTDSEGVVCMRISEERLDAILSGRGIPESHGHLHIRAVHRTRQIVPFARRAICTIEKGAENLKQAAELGEGPQAFLQCAATVSRDPPVMWKSALSYDLSYVAQRRLMMQRFLAALDSTEAFEVDPKLTRLLDHQIELAAEARQALCGEDIAALVGRLGRLSEAEEVLTRQWEVWIRYDRNQ